jgi:hypothetical protein
MTMKRTSAWALAVLATGFCLSGPRASAQEGGERGGGQFAGMQRAGGEVTAVAGATLTIRTETGDTMKIVTTDNTKVMKGRGQSGGPVKFSDLKVGDGVMAAGNLDAQNKTLHAAIVFATDAVQVKALKENLGKTYIAGTVKSIDLDDAKMTVERPDHVMQTIGFDEGTSFRRGRGMRMNGFGAGGAPEVQATGEAGGESITLADIKVGDNVGGQGSLKSGVFVPTQLMVSTPGARRRGAGGAAGSSTPPPGPQ